MRIADLERTYTAIVSRKTLEPRFNLAWRRAGGPAGRHQVANLMTADMSHEIASVITGREAGDIPRHAGLYIIDRAPFLHLGPLSDEELDALGGCAAIARGADTISIAVAANGVHLLVRLCSNGLLEVIAFCRPDDESGFVQVVGRHAGSTMFLIYRRFDDLVCGKLGSGTRVTDVARISCWNDVVALMDDGRPEEAAAVFEAWFAREINTRYQAPYFLSCERQPQPTVKLNADTVRQLETVLLHLSPALPAAVEIQMPETPIGRARIIDLSGHASLSAQVSTAAKALCGLIVFEAEGSGLYVAKDTDLHPLMGHALSDIAKAQVIRIATDGGASAHRLIATRSELARLWSALQQESLVERLAIIAREHEPAALMADIDAWVHA